MATIFHIATAEDWAAAQEAGAYTTSTRGRTLAEVGFVHCSRGDQWPRVRDALYDDVTEPLLLLKIDTDLLDVPVVEEPGEPGSSETFPHVYGPLPVEAVVQAIPLPRPRAAAADPAATRAPAAGAEVVPGQSFTAIFFREMFRNAAIASLVLVAGVVGLAVGATMGDALAPALGGLIGLLLGGIAGRLLYVRASR